MKRKTARDCGNVYFMDKNYKVKQISVYSFIPLSMKLKELSAKLTNKYKAECLTKLSRTSLAGRAGEVKCTYFYL